MRGVEAQIDALRRRQAADEQAGDDEQRQRSGDLSNDQEPAKALSIDAVGAAREFSASLIDGLPQDIWTVDAAGGRAVRAADLAASLGRDTAPFKLDVRKLKALGLTISLEVGYRLSARGEAVLRKIP